MGVRRLSRKGLSNTRLKFDSDDDDFETPAFKSVQKHDGQNTHENSDEESDVNTSGDDEEVVAESDQLCEIVSEDDSDDVPEEVTFSESRDAALAQLNTVMKQIRDENEEKRTKRRRQDALFKQQKKKKLEMFVSQKLPGEFLDSLPEELEKRPRKEVAEIQEPAPDEECQVEGSETEHIQETDDYIPLNRSQGFEVVSLKDDRPNHKSLAQSAAEFRQNRLYGGKIRRESFHQTLSRIEKRRVRRK